MKNNQPTYGFRLHVGVDERSGIIRKAEMTAARTHNSRVFDELLIGDEQAVYADKAYDDIQHEKDKDDATFTGFIGRISPGSRRTNENSPIDGD